MAVWIYVYDLALLNCGCISTESEYEYSYRLLVGRYTSVVSGLCNFTLVTLQLHAAQQYLKQY